MENGFGNLADKMSVMAVNDSAVNSGNNNDSLYQVMKAVEAADATIRQQVEENDRLRVQLQKKTQELEKFKLDASVGQRIHSDDKWDEQAHSIKKSVQSGISVGNQGDAARSMDNTYVGDPPEGHAGSSRLNGVMKVLPSGQSPLDNALFSQLSSPSTASFSPSRHQMEGDYDPRLNLSGNGMIAMADVNNSGNMWKQNREHEEEIMQLRKHLAEFSVKEAQIRNEKYVLEKRIAYMRMAFDQQQQDLVDAASKALSYRQDIIEENIRLTYALQDAQQERTTFVSSLLPLLAEYSLQPQVADAQSIVSNLKVLFKHLQEKLVFTETKLKDAHYQLAPWRSGANQSNFSPSSPSPSIGVALATSNKNGLELVPQPTYSLEKIPLSSSSTRAATDWDLLGHQRSGLGGFMANNQETDELGRHSPLASRHSTVHDVSSQLPSSRTDVREAPNKQVTFSDPVSTSQMDDPDMERQQNDSDPSSAWESGNTPYTTALDDPSSSYSPYLPPVLEEPSSSFSEAAEDDPLPAIEGLQISGEALPGHELQACGYSINGTTSCNFEWVRHLENGSVNYIEGAKQPTYLVTADDVDAYLAIEVQPLDNRKRKGELVKVFANEHKKITCDSELQNQIEKALFAGQASYKVSISTGYIDIWEPATLAIKRDGYSIKCSAPSGLGVTEKFSPTTKVKIPYGKPSVFSIMSSGGVERTLKADDSADISCSRDTVVLTMRLFIIRASEKKKGKKKSLFFNK